MDFFVSRQRPALGECLASLAAAIPVAFLEPTLNRYNPLSVFNTKTPRERSSKYLPAEVINPCAERRAARKGGHTGRQEAAALQHWQFPQFERGRRSEPRLCCLSPPSYWKNGNGQVPPNPPNPKPQILLSAMGVRSPPAPGDVATCLQFLSTVSALIT